MGKQRLVSQEAAVETRKYRNFRWSLLASAAPRHQELADSEHQSISSLLQASVYASIRQGKAKPGMAEELTRRIKEGAIPIISDVEGFRGYYVVYAPDDTVTAISIFNDYAGAEESNRRAMAWIEQNLGPLLAEPATAIAGPVIVHTLA